MSEIFWLERWWLNSWPHRFHIRRSVPVFLRSCPEPFRGEVLEVGAGNGWTSRRIMDTFPQVELTATDVDESVMESLKEIDELYGQRLNVQVADVSHLSFDRASFDIVIAVHLLRRLDDAPHAIQELVRVLRPGGLIGIADSMGSRLSWMRRFGPWKKNGLMKEELAELLTEETELLVQRGHKHYYLWARKPYPVSLQ